MPLVNLPPKPHFLGKTCPKPTQTSGNFGAAARGGGNDTAKGGAVVGAKDRVSGPLGIPHAPGAPRPPQRTPISGAPPAALTAPTGPARLPPGPETRPRPPTPASRSCRRPATPRAAASRPDSWAAGLRTPDRPRALTPPDGAPGPGRHRRTLSRRRPRCAGTSARVTAARPPTFDPDPGGVAGRGG